MKFFKLSILLLLFTVKAYSQDIIVLTNGDVLRGTIKGANYSALKYSLDEGPDIVAGIKDVKEFVWNGETYILKTFFTKKSAENRFVRVIETGKVNLYAIGGQNIAAAPKQSRVKVRPSFGVGLGTGGLGSGVGGSISIGGGRGDDDRPVASGSGKTYYFIEKPGTGALQEVSPGDTEKTKALLLQKLGDDEDLAGRIKTAGDFSGMDLVAFVRAYNEMHK